MKDYSTYIIVWDNGIGCNSIHDNEKLKLLESTGAEWWQGILSDGCCEKCSTTQDGYAIDGFSVDVQDNEKFLDTLFALRQIYKFHVFKDFSL